MTAVLAFPMRLARLAVTLLLLLALPASAAEPRGRGALTVVGVGLTAAGLALGGLAAGAFLNASQWDALYAPYDATRPDVMRDPSLGAMGDAEKTTVGAFFTAKTSAQQLGTIFLIAGGASLALGLAALVLDGVLGAQPVSVALLPTAHGGAAVFGLRF